MWLRISRICLSNDQGGMFGLSMANVMQLLAMKIRTMKSNHALLVSSQHQPRNLNNKSKLIKIRKTVLIESTGNITKIFLKLSKLLTYYIKNICGSFSLKFQHLLKAWNNHFAYVSSGGKIHSEYIARSVVNFSTWSLTICCNSRARIRTWLLSVVEGPIMWTEFALPFDPLLLVLMSLILLCCLQFSTGDFTGSSEIVVAGSLTELSVDWQWYAPFLHTFMLIIKTI